MWLCFGLAWGEFEFLVAAFVIVEVHFKHPVGRCQIWLKQLRDNVAILDVL